MNIIARNTDYAIRALCFIAKKETKITSVTELVKELKIPKPFLRKILQKLNQKRVLKSYKGKGGGFILAIKPGSIFVVDLIKIFQGPVKLQRHFFKKCFCPNTKSCILKKELDDIEKYVISRLNKITIKSLLTR